MLSYKSCSDVITPITISNNTVFSYYGFGYQITISHWIHANELWTEWGERQEDLYIRLFWIFDWRLWMLLGFGSPMWMEMWRKHQNHLNELLMAFLIVRSVLHARENWINFSKTYERRSVLFSSANKTVSLSKIGDLTLFSCEIC